MKKSNSKLFKTIFTVGIGLALTACGGSDSEKVSEPDPVANSAPVISSTGTNQIEAGTTYSYTLISSDADNNALTLSVSTLPAWLSFDSATGILSGTPAADDAGEYAITLTVSDGTDTVSQSFTITVTLPVVVNNAPVITSVGITNATVGESYSYTLTATDADSDTLTLSTTIPSALSWLTFDAATGILSGIPASGDVAATEITLTVSDGADDTSQTFAITVTDVIEAPTEFVIYNEAENPLWPSWANAGPTPVVMADTDVAHGNVMQFTINNSGDGTVVGFNARDAVDGIAYAMTAGTTLEFDFKLTTMPTAGVVDWRLKLEDSGDGAHEVAFSSSQEGHTTPVLDTWMHYSFNVDTYGLDDTDLIMLFPAWAKGDGAVYSVDNVAFTTRNVVSSFSGGDLIVDPNVGIDFEGTESQQASWEAFENGDSPAVEFVDNPSMVGNTSTTVGKLSLATAEAGTGKWAGAVTHTVQSFALDSSNALVKVWVYKSKISPVGIKFEKRHADGWGAHPPRFATNTKINEWEELTIDFSADIGLPENDAIEGIAIFPDNVDGRDANIVYFDNITFHAGDNVTTPTVDPSTLTAAPTLAAGDVISLHTSGDVYSNITVNEWNPNWGQGGSISDATVAGKIVKKVDLANYQGIDFVETDITGKATLHMSVFADSTAAFNVFVITGAAELAVSTGSLVAGTWNNIEVDLSATGSLATAFQIKFDGGTGQTLWLDNVYFH